MPTTHLTQSLHRALREYPHKLATIFGARRRSYAEFADRVARLANGLQQMGMTPGARVAMLAMNSDRYLEFYFAVWWGGGVVNPVNVRWSAREIAYSLDDCDTRLLIVDGHFAAMTAELVQRSTKLRTVIYAGDAAASAGMFDYEQLIADHAPIVDAMRCDGDLAGVFYTGGTTGFPKGVMLSHANLHSNATLGFIEHLVRDDDVGLHAAPMFHLADGVFAQMLCLRGCTQVIVPGFQPETVLQAIQQESVSNALLVPTMIQMLVDHPRLPDYRIGSLQHVLYGASPINEALLDRAMQQLPGVRFSQAYGQTEMSAVVSVLGSDYHSTEGRARGKVRSAGRPASGVEVRIVDAQGDEVLAGKVGEITARGPGVMLGYWNNPAQTKAALRGGWMHTGDAAYQDEDDFLFIVDRVKDMIVSGGENVYSAEVENAIAQHAGVAACAVIGIPDERWGEAVHAVIVRKPVADAFDDEAVKRHCRELIAGYKCPRSIEFRDALPLSGAGKVLKNALREPYWQAQQRRVG
jgi:acyl-CoA synthetase (AMP-forming)/AMP-acid ligase II